MGNGRIMWFGPCWVCLNTSGVSALRRFSGPFPVPLILALIFGLD